MTSAYILVALASGAAVLAALWSSSPVLALASAPFMASAVVLVLGVFVAKFGPGENNRKNAPLPLPVPGGNQPATRA